MFCPKCGAEIESDSRFCERCGSELAEGEAKARAAPLSLPLAAAIGAAAAVAGGALASFAAFRLWVWAMISDLEQAAGTDAMLFQIESALNRMSPKLSFLNYYAYHQITIGGRVGLAKGGASGAGHVSMAFPILIHVLLPILAIALGAYLAAHVRRSRDARACARTGLLTGVLYAFLMVVLKPFATLRTGHVDFDVPYLGEILPSLAMGPKFWSTVFHAALFGVIFGWIGGRARAVGWRFWRTQEGDPRWLLSLDRSALTWGGLAFAKGLGFMMILVTAALILWLASPWCPDELQDLLKSEDTSYVYLALWYVLLLPALAGANFYLAQCIGLAGHAHALGFGESVQGRFSASLLHGYSWYSPGASEYDAGAFPGEFYLLMIIPAVVLISSGYRLACARGARDPARAAIEGAKIAGPYMLFLLLFRPLFGGHLSTSFDVQSGDFGAGLARMSVSMGPSFWGTVFWGLVWGAVMGAGGGGLAAFFGRAPAVAAPRACEHCGAEISEDSEFCEACGQPVSAEAGGLFCPHCGAREPVGAQFCSQCGKAMTG